MVVRTYEDELQYLEKLNDYSWRIKKGFVPNMKVNSHVLNQFVQILFVTRKGGRNILCQRALARAHVRRAQELV